MALLYIDETQASLNRAEVKSGKVVHEGEFIVQNGDGTVEAFDPANDTLPHGIVVHHPGGDSIVKHDEDYVNYEDLWKYKGDEDDRLYYQPLAAVNDIMPRIIDKQTSPDSSEPTITEGTVMGIVNLGSGQTRVVPSGYTYDGTTYSESGAGDFVAIGRVDKKPQQLRIDTAYGLRVPIRLDADEFNPSVNN